MQSVASIRTLLIQNWYPVLVISDSFWLSTFLNLLEIIFFWEIIY